SLPPTPARARTRARSPTASGRLRLFLFLFVFFLFVFVVLALGALLVLRALRTLLVLGALFLFFFVVLVVGAFVLVVLVFGFIALASGGPLNLAPAPVDLLPGLLASLGHRCPQRLGPLVEHVAYRLHPAAQGSRRGGFASVDQLLRARSQLGELGRRTE